MSSCSSLKEAFEDLLVAFPIGALLKQTLNLWGWPPPGRFTAALYYFHFSHWPFCSLRDIHWLLKFLHPCGHWLTTPLIIVMSPYEVYDRRSDIDRKDRGDKCKQWRGWYRDTIRGLKMDYRLVSAAQVVGWTYPASISVNSTRNKSFESSLGAQFSYFTWN